MAQHVHQEWTHSGANNLLKSRPPQKATTKIFFWHLSYKTNQETETETESLFSMDLNK